MSDSPRTRLQAAEERFEDAVRLAEREVARARQVVQQTASSQRDRAEAEKLFKEHARSPNAPEPIRKLYRRIAAGEITWDDVLSGRAGTEELQATAEATGALDEFRERLEASEDPAGTADDAAQRRWSSPYNSYARQRSNRPPGG